MLCGGLLPQSTVLVRGAPGVGKTTLGLQFLLHGAMEQGSPALLVTFEEFPKSIYRDAASLGWDLRALEAAGRVQVHFTSPLVFLRSLESPTSPMSELIRTYGIQRLVLDSMTHFCKLTRDTEELRQTYNQVVNAIKREEITSLLLSEAPSASSLMENDFGHLLYVVDGVILLNYVETDSAMERAMTILKMRGTDHAKEIRSFEIKRGGIQINGPFLGREAILTGAARLRRDYTGGASND